MLYIRILNPPENVETKNLEVRFQGVKVAEIKGSEKSNDYLIFKAQMSPEQEQRKYTAAMYRIDMWGDSFFELTTKNYKSNGGDSEFNYGDTLIGVYSPIFPGADSLQREHILQGLRELKDRLDTLVNN